MSLIRDESTSQKISQPIDTPLPIRYRLLMILGLVGAVLFTITYLIEGVTRPGYDAWKQPISALSLGPGGWIQITNFIVFGLLVSCSAIGLRAALAPGIGATWAPLLHGLAGLGLILDGVFVQDPEHGYPPGAPTVAIASVHGTIHFIDAIVTLSLLVIACFVIARRFVREPHWRGWATYSIVTGLLICVFMTAYGIALSHDGLAGVFERLALIVQSIWMTLFIVRLLTGTGTGRVSFQGQAASRLIPE
jgi:hypothetical protein